MPVRAHLVGHLELFSCIEVHGQGLCKPILAGNRQTQLAVEVRSGPLPAT